MSKFSFVVALNADQKAALEPLALGIDQAEGSFAAEFWATVEPELDRARKAGWKTNKAQAELVQEFVGSRLKDWVKGLDNEAANIRTKLDGLVKAEAKAAAEAEVATKNKPAKVKAAAEAKAMLDKAENRLDVIARITRVIRQNLSGWMPRAAGLAWFWNQPLPLNSGFSKGKQMLPSLNADEVKALADAPDSTKAEFLAQARAGGGKKAENAELKQAESKPEPANAAEATRAMIALGCRYLAKGIEDASKQGFQAGEMRKAYQALLLEIGKTYPNFRTDEGAKLAPPKDPALI